MRPQAKPVGQQTLADSATALLHEQILVGDLAAGSPLRLHELSASLGMSMMPIREALRRLDSLGLVEVIPHKGTWVRELTLDDLYDTHQMRLLLEATAIQKAAPQFTDAAARQATDALDRHVRAHRAGDRAAARRAHTDFHFAIYAASNSPLLLRALEPVWQNSERYRFAGVPDESSLAERTAEHEAILIACKERDTDQAIEMLRQHLERAHLRTVRKMTRR